MLIGIRSFMATTMKTTAIKKIFHTNFKQMSSSKQDSIVWMDLEMTGLNLKTDKILEISCIITDKNLVITAEGPTLAIHQSENILNSMNEWCLKNHGESGLTDSCRKSIISQEDAETIILNFIKENQIPERACPLAGNTIYMDRMFLRKYMPQVDEYLHYRIIDVSSIKELCKRWQPQIFARAPKKELKHRTLDDIKESINELKYYRELFFIN